MTPCWRRVESTSREWDGFTTPLRENILAHNIVSTHYFAGTFHVPLDFEIYVKKKDCQDESKFRTKDRDCKGPPEEGCFVQPSRISVLVFDSWYADEGLISLAKSLGIEAYVTEERSTNLILSDDSKTKMNFRRLEKTIPRDKSRPVEIYTSLVGEKRTYYAFCTTVRMNHLDGVKVKLVISYKDKDLGGEPSFYISNIIVWESKKILQTYAFRWSIEGFHRDAKQSLGLEDYQMRKINGVKRHISMVFFAYSLSTWLWL